MSDGGACPLVNDVLVHCTEIPLKNENSYCSAWTDYRTDSFPRTMADADWQSSDYPGYFAAG